MSISEVTEIENLTFNTIKNQSVKIQKVNIDNSEREYLVKLLKHQQNRLNTEWKDERQEYDKIIRLLKKLN